MFLADFHFCCFTFKDTPSCSFKYFEKFQKEKFASFCFSYVLNRAKKDKIVAESLDVQIEQRRILI